MSPSSPNQVDTSVQTVGFAPTGGVNLTDNYANIGPTEVSNGANMLFDSGVAYVRPQAAGAQTNIPDVVVFAGSVSISNSLYNIIITNTNRVFLFDGTFFGTEITPAGNPAVFGMPPFNNLASVDGTLLIGNQPGALTAGLVNWDPNGTTYTIISDAPYRYVAGHYSRAIAAVQNAGGNTLSNFRTFAWSTPGDITTWTSTDGSAGSNAIAEIEDSITGLGVLHNIVVIPRSYGIHLAYPTGTLPLPYDFQGFIRRGSGCLYPATCAWSDEFMFCVGEYDVFQFDLQTMKPIGYKIRASLIALLRGGVNYNGCITRIVKNGNPRWRYHLVPVQNSSNIHPQFTYDVFADNWSVHNYISEINWAWDLAAGNAYQGFAFMDNSSSAICSTWDASEASEETPFLTKYLGVKGALDSDFTIRDAMIHNVDYGANDLTLTIAATLAPGNVTSKSTTTTIGASSNLEFVRNWLTRQGDLRISGNEFLVTLTPQTAKNFATDGFKMRLVNTSEYRG